MSNNANNVDNFINTLNRRYPNINSNVQFFLDMIQNEFGDSLQSSDNNNISVEQISELFRNTSQLRSQPTTQHRASMGSSNFNRYNSTRSREVDSVNLNEFEGFAEPLENRRFSDQAAQNLDSLSRIPYGSEGPLGRGPERPSHLSGPQPGTPLWGVHRNPTTNTEALGFDNNTTSGENRRTSRTNSLVDELNDIPINPDSIPVIRTSNEHPSSLDDQIRRNQNSIRDIIDNYNDNTTQYNRNMDRWIMSYNDNFHQYQHNTEHIIRLLQEFQSHIIQIHSRTNIANPPATRFVNSSRANTRTGIRYTTHNNTNPINWTEFIPLRYNSTRYLDNRLTQAQIDLSTQIIEYDENMDEERCPISWEDFVVGEQICQIKECEHIFKSTSLLNWLRTNSHCPVCRYDLRTYNGTTPGRVSRTTSNRSNRTRPEQVSDIDVSLNTVDMDNQDANENPYIDNNDEIETIYTTSIDLDINSINNLDAILESVMQQIGDDIIRSYDASNNDI